MPSSRGSSRYPAGGPDIIRLAIILLLAPFVAVLHPTPLEAQIGSDAVPQQRIVPEKELLERQLEGSRLRLGALRIQPLFALRSLGYDSNVYSSFGGDEVGDWTATVAGGAAAIVPAGRKVFIRGHGIAEYTWFDEQKQQRNLGWDGGASVLGLFNRMSAEVTGRSSETVGSLSSELDLPVVRNLSSLSGRTELNVLPRTSFFAEAEARDYENSLRVEDEEEFPDVELLDRRDSGWRIGARYEWSETVDLSIATERTRTLFDRNERELDNEGFAVLAGIRIGRPLYFLNVSGGYRNIELTASPVDYSTLTGSYFAARSLGKRTNAEVFGRRNIAYGLFADTPFFVETRNGVAGGVRLGRRTRARAFVEVGNNDYPVAVSSGGPASSGRFDRVRTAGGSLSVLLFRSAELTIQVSDTKFESNIQGFDRSVFRVTSGITFRGDGF